MLEIHPSAQVSPRAKLHADVEIGPLCVVGDDVEIGRGTRLIASCVVLGHCRIGEGNIIFPYAVIGAEPQDRSHEGEVTSLVIGDRNVFREHVTVHRGTLKEEGTTRVGSDCLLMVGTHVAHDAVIGDAVTLANGTMLAGHVKVESRVTTGGRAAVAPFVRLGEGSFIAAGAMVEIDVPPFTIVAGDRARVRALNRVGLRRQGVPDVSRRALGRAFRVLFGNSAPRSESLRAVQTELAHDPYVSKLVTFLSRSS
ncbi:MAG TPA: acyl-ACP--UDP-N-acetylglucosamine O-acyltransferase [Polyangiaceae bacterium]|nr:acyl-ACP--UDP-N-acetylglucosamine O-acyltransferase [Polyangiaceae bacterium]